MSDPIGDWYETQRRRAATLAGLLEIAKQELAERPTPELHERVRRLERELEQARYVGD